MNIQEYISSGILESYVLGNATPEEIKEVEIYASKHPEIKLELEEIEKAMNTYATQHSITPPAHLKEKILGKIVNESQTPANEKEAKVISLYDKETKIISSNSSYWSIAASILFLVSAGFAVYFAMRSSSLTNSVNDMAKANTALSDSIKAISSNLAQVQNDMTILKDPKYKVVELKGLKVAPESKAMVCWSPQDKKVYIEIDKLPAPPQGMQYQLWAIVDGKPVSEGMLAMGTGLHHMEDVGNAQAFAVTLEREGGSPTPKGDMYVMGTI